MILKLFPVWAELFYMQFNAQISVMVAVLLCFIVRHTCLNCAVYEKDHPVMQYSPQDTPVKGSKLNSDML